MRGVDRENNKMKLKCRECNAQLENLEGGYYRCPNCNLIYVVWNNSLRYVSALGGMITSEFQGDVADIMVTGEDAWTD